MDFIRINDIIKEGLSVILLNQITKITVYIYKLMQNSLSK